MKKYKFCREIIISYLLVKLSDFLSSKDDIDSCDTKTMGQFYKISSQVLTKGELDDYYSSLCSCPFALSPCLSLPLIRGDSIHEDVTKLKRNQEKTDKTSFDSK